MRNMSVDTCRHPRRQKCDHKEADKILKYKYVTIEIQRMWNVKTKAIPVITGAAGII
jgi:hypothetical protein